MAYLMTLFAVCLPTLVGFGLVNIFLSKKDDASFAERLAFGFCLGLMLTTIVMYFVFSGLHIPFSAPAISIALLPFLLAGIYVTYKNELADLDLSGLKTLKPLEMLLIALILLQIFFVFSSLMIKPVSGCDAWANYSLRAKAYFIDKSAHVPLLPETIQGLNNSLNQTWVFVCINEWNDILGKIMFPFYYVSLLLLFYFAARRVQPRLTSLLTTYILSSLPFLVYHATIEYCDLMVAIYLFAAISLMFLWFNKLQNRYLMLSFIFLFSTILIKKESFFHIAIISAVFLAAIFSKKMGKNQTVITIRKLSFAYIAAGIAFLLWMVLISPQDGILFVRSIDLSRIPVLLSVFSFYLFTGDNWNIVWSMLIILLIFKYKRLWENYNMYLLAIILLELVGFMAYYFFSQQDIFNWLFIYTPALRNMLQFMPVVVLLISNLLFFDDKTILPSVQPKRKLPSKK
jgi:hypothetical protein